MTRLLYTKWRNVLVFRYIGRSFLLQGCKNKITGAIKFKISSPSRFLIHCEALTEDSLKNCGLWE